MHGVDIRMRITWMKKENVICKKKDFEEAVHGYVVTDFIDKQKEKQRQRKILKGGSRWGLSLPLFQ